jgi:hypothetical protein
MDNERPIRNIYKCKPLRTPTAGTSKHWWEDDVMRDMQLLKIKKWTKSIQNMEGWRRIVEKVRTFKE